MKTQVTSQTSSKWPNTGLFIIARKVGDDIEYFQNGYELIEFGPYDENWSTDSGSCIPFGDTKCVRDEIKRFTSVFKDMNIQLAEIMIYPKDDDETTN